MPWQRTDPVMERMKFIVAVNEAPSGETFAETCRRFGISRPTGYKWLARYEAGGPAALGDRPPLAYHHPLAVDVAVEDLVVAARKAHPRWGPRKLKALLEREHPGRALPAASTMGEILDRRGMITPRNRRRRYPPSGVGQSIYDHPNAVWCMDHKGDFPMLGGGRCGPFTLMDGDSRYLLRCEAVRSTGEAETRPHLESAMREFGVPEALRSDGGSPFASAQSPGRLTKLAVWLIKLGIELHRNWPGHPEQNPRLERYHGTMVTEVVQDGPYTWEELRRRLDAHRREYNQVRPHEALSQRTPASAYQPSPRALPSEVGSPEYAHDHCVRRTDSAGRVNWRGHLFNVGSAISCEPVYFQDVGEELWDVYFGRHFLLQVELRGEEPRIRTAPPGTDPMRRPPTVRCG